MCRLVTVLTSFFFLFFAAGASAQAPLATAPDDAIIEGVVQIKLDAPTVAAVEATTSARGVVEQKTAGGVPLTGVASLDALGEEYEAVRIERVFRPAGKNEARHLEFGLHRWYRVTFNETSLTQSAAGVREAVAAYAAASGVEIAEATYEKTFSDGYEPGKMMRRVVEPDAVRVATLPRRNLSGVEGGAGITNDPLYGDQWHYHNTGQLPESVPGADIDLPEAHDIQTGDAGVVVSIHDQGIQTDHEDLAANMWVNEGEIPGNDIDDDDNGFVDDVYGYNFADDQGTILPGDHGTHVAGTVAAVNNNETGVAGVAGGDGTPGSGVRVMSAQVFGATGGSGFAESYVYAADMGAVISQNSWGYTNPGVYEQAVLDAIDYYNATAGSEPGSALQGGLVIFAAGNSNADDQWYPGYYEPTVAVASTDASDLKSGFSNYGEWVDISAPGGFGQPYDEDDVLSTLVGNNYGYLAGTSMACPHASGMAALLVSQNFGATDQVIRSILESTTDDIDDQNPEYAGLLGTGRINAATAVGTTLDDIDPGDVTDLAASLSGNHVTLTWTAPADDAGDPESGPVSGYDVRYATNPIVDVTDFDNATPVTENPPSPSEPGTQESFTVTGFPYDTDVWFAIRSIDDTGNLSAVSNAPSIATGPAPTLAYGPEAFDATLSPNQDTTLTLTLSNTGPAESILDFSFPTFAALDLLSRPGIEKNDTSVPAGLADPKHEKGEDPYAGLGNPVVLGAGGPDNFGYVWIDSDTEGGPVYDWVDITGVGTELLLTDEDAQAVSLPFSFWYYGEEQTEVTVTSNGYLAFDGSPPVYTNHGIPNPASPNGVIAPFWDDLNPETENGQVHYYADTENDRFIVQYTNVYPYSPTGELPDSGYTFQVILNADGTIRFQYEDMEGGAPLNSASVGIESIDGSDGLRIAYIFDYIHNGLAVHVGATRPFIAGVSPANGSLSGGSDQSIDVTLTSEGASLGIYRTALDLATSDPAVQQVSIPAELTVQEGVPAIAVDPATLDYGDIFVGASRMRSVTIANPGGSPLTVSSITSDNSAFVPEVETPLTIPFNESVEVGVRFTPGQVSEETGTLTIQSNAPDTLQTTVDLSGTGLPAPVVATAPDSLSETLEIGQTGADTLVVGNDGGAPLDFTAYFRPDVTHAPEDVASPAPTSTQAPSGLTELAGVFHATEALDTESPTPLELMEATYQIDDGTAENGLGLGGQGATFDIMWLNAFEAIEGAGTITTISTAWSCPSCSVLPEGTPARVFVYDDPNDDGDPTDAVLLSQAETSVTAPNTDAFTTAFIPPTHVDGTFFIAVLLEDNDPSTYPAPMDTSSPFQDASWFAGALAGEDFNIDDLSANSVPPTSMSAAGFPANLLLRADGSTPFVAVSPESGSLEPGTEQALLVEYDASDLDAGVHEGDIIVGSNDPVTPMADVPTTLVVGHGAPALAVDPENLDFGEVFAQDVHTLNVTLINTGLGPLEVASVASDAGVFVVSADSVFTIARDDSATVAVTFAPEAVESYTGTFSIETNDPDVPTATVALAGTGIAPPVAAVAPDSLGQTTLTRGETAVDTLMITNDGSAPLDFAAYFQPDLDVAPEDVAASTSDALRMDPELEALKDLLVREEVTGFNPPPPADSTWEDGTYRLDDGTTDNIGFLPAGDVMWLNAFQALDGSDVITTISTAWGYEHAPTPPEGSSATVYLYDDPNNDGEPSDAVLLTSAETQVENGGMSLFTTVPIEPTEVQGTFFVAALVREVPQGLSVAPLDASPSFDASWGVISAPGEFDPENLGNNDNLLLISDLIRLAFGFDAGNWLLRAGSLGGARYTSVSPQLGTVAPGASQPIEVAYDATDTEAGVYPGHVFVETNDPVTPSTTIPAQLEIEGALSPFVLAPEAVSTTLDLAKGDSTTSQSVTITNTSDEAQTFRIETYARVEGDSVAQAGRGMFGEERSLDEVGVPFRRMSTSGVMPLTSQHLSNTTGILDRFVYIDPENTEDVIVEASSPQTIAGDFAPGDETHLYIITARSMLESVDTDTWERTTIGRITPDVESEEYWLGMSGDPSDGTLYAVTEGNDREARLYTVNPETAEATLVGDIVDATDGDAFLGVVDIAIDGEGQMYGYTIGYSTPERLLRIDKNTGAATVVGDTGISNGGNSGLDFDLSTGTLYATAIKNSIIPGQNYSYLLAIDPETGEATVVGNLPMPDREVPGLYDYLALPSGGYIFVDTGLRTGTIEAGGSLTLETQIDARGLIEGTYEGDFVVRAIDAPGEPASSIPFSLTVQDVPEATLVPVAQDFGSIFAGGDTTQVVTLVNTGGDALNVSNLEVSPAVFSLPDSVETSFTLAPGEAWPFVVTFAPDAVQSYKGTFTVTSDDPDANTVTATLTGEGISAPSLALDPEAFDLRAYAGQTYERTLAVTNEGGNPLTYGISGDFVSFEVGGEAPQGLGLDVVLLEEDFNEAIPKTWTVTDVIENDISWILSTSLDNDHFLNENFTGGDGAAAMTVPYEHIQSSYDTRLVTPPLTAENSDEFIVSFLLNFHRSALRSDTLDVDITTDGGETWETVENYAKLVGNPIGNPTIQGKQIVLDLAPLLEPGDTFQIRWRHYNYDFDSNYGSGYYLQIDDVKVARTFPEFLSVTPAADTLAAGETRDVALSVDATGLDAGTYEVNLNLTTNDPAAERFTVPVTLEVIEHLTVTPEPGSDTTRQVYPAEEFLVPLTVESVEDLGVRSFEFTLGFADSLFTALGVETEGTLSENAILSVNTDVPGEISVAAIDTTAANAALVAGKDRTAGRAQGNATFAEKGSANFEAKTASPPPLFTLAGEDTLLYVRLEAAETFGESELAFTDFLFNEGEPPVATDSTTYAVGALYGDVSLDGAVAAFDVALVMDAVVGAIELTPIQELVADVSGNGEVAAFDAALIMDFLLGRIECFPVEEGCEENVQGLVAKNTESGNEEEEMPSVTGLLDWGAPERTQAPVTEGKGVAPESEGYWLEVPIVVTPEEGNIKAVEVTAGIDTSAVRVEDVEGSAPEGWHLAHHVSEGGRFTLALAGSEPLTDGPVASVTLRVSGAQEGIPFTDARYVFNESEAQAVGTSAGEGAKTASVEGENATLTTTLPETFAVLGNYPNPTSGETRIGVDLPAPAEITVSVYDALGRRVLERREELDAGAGRELRLDARSLPSGTYFYRLDAVLENEQHVETGSFVLVR